MLDSILETVVRGLGLALLLGIREFVRDALSAELGLTVPDEFGQSFGRPADDDEAIDPEAGVRSIDAIASFLEYVAPPPLARTAPYLHDARASSIEGAVAEHAGEASTARTEATNLSTGDKEALFAFVTSL